MTYIPSTRSEWTIEGVLSTPLSEESGAYLRYDPIYDEIREARREDDPQLSQGVWQTEHKRANWIAVEFLCVEALTNKTRDLQLALWLAEALTAMDGIAGLIRGLELTHTMCERFWDTYYPVEEDFRLSMWEWIDQELHRRLILLPITHKGRSYNDWLNAVNLESIRQRASHRLPNNAVTISIIRKELENPERPVGLGQLDALDTILSKIRELLDSKYADAPGLTVIRRTVQEMRPICAPIKVAETIITKTEDENVVPSEATSAAAEGEAPVLISERSHAYQAIRDIGQFLATLEPHSPVPPLLIMSGNWENASLPQILSDIQQKPDLKSLLVMLSGQHS